MSHSFLLVRLGSMGDVIHAIPTAAALRARFPEARIDWMVDPRYVALLEMVRGIDSRIAVNTRRVGSTFATLGDLRGVGYSAVIDLQGLLKSAVLARAVGAERTIGFASHHLRERTAGPFYTHRVDPTGAARHLQESRAARAARQPRHARRHSRSRFPTAPWRTARWLVLLERRTR